MQIETLVNTSSALTCVCDPEVISVTQLDGTAGPSLRSKIVVKRTSLNGKVITFKTTYGSCIDPTLSKRSNVEPVRKTYSITNRKRKDPLENTLIKVCGKKPVIKFENILDDEITDQILNCLFITSVYTINNYFGKQGPRSSDSSDLYMYIHKLFCIDKCVKNSCYEVAKGIEPPKFYINLIIIEANSLKHVNHLDYLFCKVWIDKKPKWVEMTHRINSTPYPVWNVRFLFLVENLKSDAIVIEMYSMEKHAFSNRKMATATYLNKLCCNVFFRKKGKCNMIGRTEIKISDIYSEGIDVWIPVVGINDETEDMFLHIEAKFKASLPEDRFDALKRHLMLLRNCVESAVKNMNVTSVRIVSWERLLSRSALTLIFLHSVISCLTPSEDIMIRFIVIAHSGLKTGYVTIEFLYNLLHETSEYLKEFPDDFIEDRIKTMYEKEAKDFHESCFQFICSLHSHNLLSDIKMVSEFKWALRSMYLCQDIINAVSAPLMILKSEAINWLEKKVEKMMKTVPENRALYIIKFLTYLLQHQKAIDDTIEEIVPEETLTKLIHQELNDKLLEPLELHVTEFCRILLESKDKKEGNTIRNDGLGLFSKIKELVFYISKRTGVPVLDLKLGKFREWFGRPVVTVWFEWCQIESAAEIENAVKSDYLECNYDNLDNPILYSSSATLTCEIIQKRLKDLWCLVSIPRAKKCDELFVSCIKSCCMKYADLLMELISYRKLLKEFHFDGRRCLCVLANNMWFVAVSAEKAILSTVGQLPLDSSNVKLILKDFCQEICFSIVDVYMIDIEYLLKSIIKDKKIKETEDNLVVYSNYIKSITWKENYTFMLYEVFILFVKCMNKRLVNIFRQYLEHAEDMEDREKFYELLLKTVFVTKEICSLPGNLEENEQIWNENYKKLLLELVDKVEQNDN